MFTVGQSVMHKSSQRVYRIDSITPLGVAALKDKYSTWYNGVDDLAAHDWVLVCAVCEREMFVPSGYLPHLCRSCGFTAHCEGY